MPKLTIDNIPVVVSAGSTILDAARQAGIDIPTLCHCDGLPAQTSCFLCVVRVNGAARLSPSCATLAADGMTVESSTPEVLAARRTALELLLSDHLGDCLAPCQLACPLHLEIPVMLRQLADGQVAEAVATIKAAVALPATLARICACPAEQGCRRAQADGAVAICALQRFAADADLAGDPYLPPCAPDTGKRVAIIGAGPAGLAAAYALRRQGHTVTVYDRRPQPGGTLRDVPADVLPPAVLDAEIAVIARLGVAFRQQSIDDLGNLIAQYDAVLVAAGAESALGLEMAKDGIAVDRHTLLTSQPGVFACGAAVMKIPQAVRAMAAGKQAAHAIGSFLAGLPSAAQERHFSVHMGHLHPDELAHFMDSASTDPRSEPHTDAEARQEAARCLHCDCRGLHKCKLYQYAVEYDASVTRFRGDRRLFEHDQSHAEVIYEPGKCIDCGLCVQIAMREQDALGLAFVGRGFTVRLAVPFNAELADALHAVARECIAACPTGALVGKLEGETVARP